MYNQHVERSAGYAGIAFVVVVLISAFLPGTPPAIDAPPAEIAAYLDAHRTAWIFAGWLTFPATVFFLWFAVQLRAFLRLAPQVDDGLATYALAGAIATVACSIVTSALSITLAFHPAASMGDAVVRALYDADNVLGALFAGPLVVTVFAASHSGRRHASLPTGLVYVGYLTAALLAVSTLSVFFTSGFLALGGIGALIIGLLPFAIWTIWTSIVLIRVPRGAAEIVVAAVIAEP